MNPRLTDTQVSLSLQSLGAALHQIRLACHEGDLPRAEAIADAFHNLPALLLGHLPDRTLDHHNELFLRALLDRYPALRGTGVELTVRE